jgi:hypothetical protein
MMLLTKDIVKAEDEYRRERIMTLPGRRASR